MLTLSGEYGVIVYDDFAPMTGDYTQFTGSDEELLFLEDALVSHMEYKELTLSSERVYTLEYRFGIFAPIPTFGTLKRDRTKELAVSTMRFSDAELAD